MINKKEKANFGGFFASLIIIVLSKIFFQLIGISNVLVNDNSILFVLFVAVVIISVMRSQVHIETEFLGLLLILFIIMIFSVIYEKSSANGFTDIAKLTITYGTVFIVLLVGFFDLFGHFSGSRSFKNIFMVFVFFQAAIVIIQHIFKMPIFNIINSAGNVITGPIVYFSGGSSRNLALLAQSGYSLRGFGMMNSGLAMGLLLTFTIAVLWNNQTKIRWQILGTVFLGIAIWSTLTRIVWVTALIVLVGYFLTKKTNSYRPIFFISELMVVINVIFIIGFNGIREFSTDNPILQTIISRLDGFRYFLESFPISGRNFLQGQNFAARRIELPTLFNPDNEILFNLLSIGLIGTLVVISSYYIIINRILKKNPRKDDFVLAKVFLILGYPIVSFGNFASFNFFGFLLIIALINKNKDRGNNNG